MPEGTRLAKMPAERSAHWLGARLQAQVATLIDYSAEIGVPLLTLAFSWLLSHREISSVIAGASSAEQVRANASAVRMLSDEQIAALDTLTA